MSGEVFDDQAVADLRARFEQGEGRIVLLPGPEPVVYLPIPADNLCGAVPSLEYRTGQLRDLWPQAVGISQCSRAPHPDGSPHISVLFVRGEDRSRTYSTQIGYPTEHTE